MFCDANVKKKFLSLIPKGRLSNVELAKLGNSINATKLYNALKAMNPNAVPGEDGLTVNFYLTYWDLLSPYLIDSYLFAFHVGYLSIMQRRGLIRLLPKKDRNPLIVSSWRPITLLNVDYKILTKLFSVRLATVLPKLIHPDQKGFTAGRSIHENLIDMQTLLSLGDELTTDGFCILLDIQKAFDTIGWGFIQSVLIQYQLPDDFIHWFDIFYSYKELYILNNGFISDVLCPARGVAQGCGISPLFFVLALKVLTLSIRGSRKLHGLNPQFKNKKVNFLADDGVLFLKWTKNAFEELLSIYMTLLPFQTYV